MRKDRALALALMVSGSLLAFLGVVDVVAGVAPIWWVRVPTAVGVGAAMYLSSTRRDPPGGTGGG